MPFFALDSLSACEIAAGFHGKFIHSGQLTLANWEIEAGASLPTHAHPHEQITQLLAGQFEFNLEGETQILTPGMVVVIPADLPHSGKALTACKIVDVFYPVREDYR